LSEVLLAADPSAGSRLSAILGKRLDSGSAQDQAFAAVALVRTGLSSDRSNEVLLNSLQSVKGSDAYDEVITALDHIQLPPAATAPLVRLLFDQREPFDARLTAVRALIRQGTTSQEAVRQLFRCRQFCVRTDGNFSETLYSALDRAFQQLGAAALPVIDENLKSSDLGARDVAAHLAGTLTCDRRSLVPGLAAGLRDNRVAKKYAAALASIGPDASAAVPDLVQLLQRGGDAAANAAQTLGALGPGAATAVPALIKALRADKRNRYEIAQALGNVGAAARSALPDLQRYSDSTEANGSVSRSAREAILKIQAVITR